jgi:hypothetical protein
MNVLLVIHYIAIEIDNTVMRRGEFRLNGKSREEVALKWWKDIKRESYLELELEKVLCDGDDITKLVTELRS